MYIRRHIESVISECLQQFPILLVTGPRQVGKTTLLQHVCKNFEYVTFDDLLVLREATEETNLFLINKKPPLLIDEVQYAPEIFRYLKIYVDKHKIKGSFALTASKAYEFKMSAKHWLAEWQLSN